MKHFATLKAKYQAAKHQDSSPVSRLYRILKQLDYQEQLRNSDITWLNEQELFETLTIFQQQEAAKEAEIDQLKDKYQAIKHPDSSLSSPLYPLLQNLEAYQQLSKSEIDWLEEHKLTETLNIVQQLEQKQHFVELKAKYKASQYEDSSPSSHLYKVLKKLELEHPLGEPDINFLKKRKLTDTITIAQDKYAATLKSKIERGEQLEESDVDWLKNNGRENIIAIAQAKHFATLKSKYNVSDYQDKSPSSPLYAILQKLEKAERLEPTDVAWLEENKIKRRQSNYGYYGWREEGYKLFSGKIWNTYHKNDSLRLRCSVCAIAHFFLASFVGAGFTTNLCHSPFTYINPPRSHPRCDRFIVLVGYPKCELNPPWESAIASFPVIWVGLFFCPIGVERGRV